jgi:hypothetical protein
VGFCSSKSCFAKCDEESGLKRCGAYLSGNERWCNGPIGDGGMVAGGPHDSVALDAQVAEAVQLVDSLVSVAVSEEGAHAELEVDKRLLSGGSGPAHRLPVERKTRRPLCILCGSKNPKTKLQTKLKGIHRRYSQT